MADTAADAGGEVISVGNQFYILATASRAAERTAVLKHDDTFAVFDYAGDIGALGAAEQGLYHEGTRYLSRFTLRVERQASAAPQLAREGRQRAVRRRPDEPRHPDRSTGQVLRRDLVHLFRARFLWKDTWHERIRLWNYSQGALRRVALTFDFDADFADIFEVRGTPRARRGDRLETVALGTRDAARLSGTRRRDAMDGDRLG